MKTLKLFFAALLAGLLGVSPLTAGDRVILMGDSLAAGGGTINGNLTVADGYTSTLDGPVVIGESLGPELLTQTCAGWGITGAGATDGAGWDCAGDTITRYASGSALTITNTAAVVGTTYKVVWTAATLTAGTFTLSVGGVSQASHSASGTFTEYITAGTTGAATFTVNSAGAGTLTLSSISMKAVTSVVTSASGPVTIEKTFADATANQAAASISTVQTGAGGDKTGLRISMVGSGTGTENALETWYNGALTNVISSTGATLGGTSATGTSYTASGITTQSATTAYMISAKRGNTTGIAITLGSATALSNTSGSFTEVAVTPTYNQLSGTADNTDLAITRTATSLGTGTQTGIKLTMPTATTNPSANAITVDATLAAMNGSDTWNGLNIDATSTTSHTSTGNAINAINVANMDEPDADATEVAVAVGTGWDFAEKYAAGLVAHTPQAVTCTAGAGKSSLTITPTAAYVEITNSDADGCDITMGETGMVAGVVVTLCVVSNAGTTVDFADTAGVTELAGAFSANIDDCITLRYGNTTTWREVSRSAN